jgi:lambda family phage portal protein
MSWLASLERAVSPAWHLKRERARLAASLLKRHYEAASTGRRTQGWRRSSADANSVVGPALSRLRDVARDLVRNNPYAESALTTIVDHAIGTGIVAKPAPANPKALAVWQAWAESTACDADGRHDFYGLQKLTWRTVVESGEVLVRRRLRRLSDGLPIPLQIQVIEPDYLDTAKDTTRLAGGGAIVQGVEYDALGKRAAYWLFQEHPGVTGGLSGLQASVRVPADGVLHIFRGTRPGQARAVSWFAPVLLRFKDFDEFEDATLMKQKIAACLAVLTYDPNGQPVGAGDADHPELDFLEPGIIKNLQAGQTVEVVQPPKVDEYDTYTKTVLRAIATGLGVTYEDLTGDYANMPFSAARMSRLRHWARVDDWRWRTIIPQFCNPVWSWAMQAAAIMNTVQSPTVGVEWTAPPPPMIDPVNEGLAFMRNVRAGAMSYSEALRERGYDPDDVMAEIAADNKKLDALGIKLDSDPRHLTQAGQAQSTGKDDPGPERAVAEDTERSWPMPVAAIGENVQ